MKNQQKQSDVEEGVMPRRIPCLITYLNPFRVVFSEDIPAWNATIDEVNTRTWDYVSLHEIVGGVDVGLESPYHLVISRDGALALPPIPDLRNDQKALEFFNRCLAALLLGGIYCEAVTSDGLDLGSIIDWKYVRSHKFGEAAPNRFHNHIRHIQSSALEAISLNDPRAEKFEDIRESMSFGLHILNLLPSLRGEYLLKGTTGIARRDWGAALANLWIVVEQLISTMWDKEVVEPSVSSNPSKSRKDQLLDTRTWTVSARIELLFQKGLIPEEVLDELNTARKARNDLSHTGKPPQEKDAMCAYRGVCSLMSVILGDVRPKLFDINLTDHSVSDPFRQPTRLAGEPKFWMAIPKLPGEEDLEREEAKLLAMKCAEDK